MEKWLYLIAGGVTGTMARYALSGLVYHRTGTVFPWGTLAVNLAGCFIIGFLDVIFERKLLIVHNYRILLMTGFCGAFTTLSSVMLETSDLLKQDKYVFAIVYIILTAAAGFAVFRAGAALAQRI